MDFANRGNRPAQTPQTPQQSSQGGRPAHPSMDMDKDNKKSNNSKKLDLGKLGFVAMLFTGTFLIIAVLLGIVLVGNNSSNKESAMIKKDKYQAIFLSSQDGQVYFGKLAIYNSDLYMLTDIYYVRVENPIQPEGKNQQAQPNISLAKLGNELHGPEDRMFISRDKVLYWENLKDDGQVVTAITNYKKNGEQGSSSNSSNSANQQQAATSSSQNNAQQSQSSGNSSSNGTDTTTP